jgi:threonine dehydratase
MALGEPSDLDIERAAGAGAGVVMRTPVVSSATLSESCAGPVVLKAENLQRTGSFKIRGAMAKLADLGPVASAGVVAGSAGNHAQAVAYAARHARVPCRIFVPATASIAKTEASRAYGASVVVGGGTLDEAVAAARAHAAEAGMSFIHPFDDPVVIAGQATLGVELAEDVEPMRQVVVPLGGGGLASGVAIAVKRRHPSVRVVGVQVESCAPYAGRVIAPGAVGTLADGIAVKRPGAITRPLVESWVDEVVTVAEDDVGEAMVFLMERAKLYAEGAGAVGVAALLSGRVKAIPTGRTVVVITGGNVDLGVLPGLVRRHETRAGRRLILFARISDQPGGLARLLTLIGENGANLIEVEHVREGVDLHIWETGVQLVLEVRDRSHGEAVLRAARAGGYELRAAAPG